MWKKTLFKYYKRLRKADRLEWFSYSVFLIFLFIFVAGVCSSTVKADGLNGSEFISDPFNTIFAQWTDPFEDMVGNGQVFWLFPCCILSIGLYVKTQDIVTTSMFMLITGALLFTGASVAGATGMSTVFIIFIAMGFTSLFIGLLLQRRN